MVGKDIIRQQCHQMTFSIQYQFLILNQWGEDLVIHFNKIQSCLFILFNSCYYYYFPAHNVNFTRLKVYDRDWKLSRMYRFVMLIWPLTSDHLGPFYLVPESKFLTYYVQRLHGKFCTVWQTFRIQMSRLNACYCLILLIFLLIYFLVLFNLQTFGGMCSHVKSFCFLELSAQSGEPKSSLCNTK